MKQSFPVLIISGLFGHLAYAKEAAGQTIGAIAVSGAASGKSGKESIDGVCAQAGIRIIKEEIEFAE